MNNTHINLHKDGEYISDYIRKYNCWEPFTTEVLNELFKARKTDTIFVDIGANIGYFTLLAAQQNIPVIAFEPIAANYELLTKSIEENKYTSLVKTYMIPLSDTKEPVIFNVSKKNMGLCSTRVLHNLDYSYSQTSTTNLFDNYLESITQKYMIVKIDVEEQENKVIKGMVNALTSGKITHIIIEMYIYDKETFDILRSCGYNYFIDIGHDGANKTSVIKTNYLSDIRYHSTLEVAEDMISSKRIQRMFLFYKTPVPI